MRAFDGSVEFQLALRNVTGRALVVADLRTAGMILPGCEIHVIMAGAAGCPCRASSDTSLPALRRSSARGRLRIGAGRTDTRPWTSH